MIDGFALEKEYMYSCCVYYNVMCVRSCVVDIHFYFDYAGVSISLWLLGKARNTVKSLISWVHVSLFQGCPYRGAPLYFPDDFY